MIVQFFTYLEIYTGDRLLTPDIHFRSGLSGLEFEYGLSVRKADGRVLGFVSAKDAETIDAVIATLTSWNAVRVSRDQAKVFYCKAENPYIDLEKHFEARFPEEENVR